MKVARLLVLIKIDYIMTIALQYMVQPYTVPCHNAKGKDRFNKLFPKQCRHRRSITKILYFLQKNLKFTLNK